MKRLVVLIAILLGVFLIFLYFYFRSHDYSLEYTVDNVNVKEEYNKKRLYYKYTLKYKDYYFEVFSKSKYTTKRKLINKINISNNDDEVCLGFKTKHVSLYPVCQNKDSYSSPFLKKQHEFSEKKNYQNIKIDNLNDKTFLLWNYQNFIYLSPKKETTIKLYNKDIYNLNLIYQMDKKLLVPDYNEDYKFKKMFIINSDNAKVNALNLRYEVYFDSYFLGHLKNKVYLYDYKNEQEYFLDLKKDEIYKTKYQILVDNKWKSVSNQDLKNEKLFFSKKEDFSYLVKDNKLYFKALDSNILYKVSDRVITNLIKTDCLDAYYISKDTLYYFNMSTGEKALLKYSEWEFNNTNMIYVF